MVFEKVAYNKNGGRNIFENISDDIKTVFHM